MLESTIQEYELHAYLDGELGPDEASDLEDRLETAPQAQALLATLAADKALVSEALGALDSRVEPLRTVALEKKLARTVAAGARRTTPASPFRVPTQLAAAVAVLAIGWWGSVTILPDLGGPAPGAVQTASIGATPEFVLEAIGAHQVFADDSSTAVEYSAAAAHLAADWFSQKMDTSVMAPDFGSLDMMLVGARLHGTKEGPLLQYVYEDRAGNRLSLTVAKHAKEVPDYKLQLLDQSDRMAGYWTKGDLDYVFVGGDRSDRFSSLVERVAQAY